MTLAANLPRYPLAFLPTPLHPLPRLSASVRTLGAGGPATTPAERAVQLWIKRDDQTGLACGGNKTRKLELLLADALARGCDTLLTTGAVQSNHCRQTAAAAARAGLACHLVLGGEPPAQPNGNLLLDRLLGAKLRWTTRENRLNRLREVGEELRGAGRLPYLITYGGSDPVGASAYTLAMEELFDQALALDLRLDTIVVASSSGGTQAGMVAGARALGWDIPILGISIDEAKADLQAKVADLATRTAAHLGRVDVFRPDEILVNDSYLGVGYGIVGDLERETIKLMAQTEGILLDPVYTGRALGGLVDLLRTQPDAVAGPDRSGPTNVLFWHTGGQPALFAYAGDLI
jgi:D-cysteine desulfhydrase family pyridoxal phosphate-dependent enzyme